nr:putative reverse transcriptase domain-containing protein [Tanacetum cinerariifolium]
MLYGRKCRALICWDQVGEHVIEGPEMIGVTNAKVAVAKEKLKEARTHRQDRVMRKKTITFVKILWKNHPEREATWETEESI